MRLLERLLTVLVVVAAMLRRTPRSGRPSNAGTPPGAGYEQSDLNVRWVAAGGVGLLVALAVVLVIVSVFEVKVTGLPATIEPPPDLVNRLSGAPTPPPPRLETAEGEQLAAYRAAAEQKLNSYGWVDRQAGTVRLPIAQAMDRVAQQGLPAATPGTARDTGVTLPTRASSGRIDERVSP